MAPSVGMVRFLLRLAMLDSGSESGLRRRLSVKMW